MRRTIGWAIALVATLAVVATLFMSTTYREWFNWGPHEPVEAAPGGTALVHGWEWELTQAYARTTFTDGSPVPEDLRFVLTTAEVRPVDPVEPAPAMCDPRLWIDGEGWFDVGGDGGLLLPEGTTTWSLGIDVLGCHLDDGYFESADSATFTWGFLVPAEKLDGAEFVSLDVTTRYIAVSGIANAQFPRLGIEPRLVR